jgi:hypothetical protein
MTDEKTREVETYLEDRDKYVREIYEDIRDRVLAKFQYADMLTAMRALDKNHAFDSITEKDLIDESTEGFEYAYKYVTEMAHEHPEMDSWFYKDTFYDGMTIFLKIKNTALDLNLYEIVTASLSFKPLFVIECSD